MILVSHRGNTHGADPTKENHPKQIELVISDYKIPCEIDLWVDKLLQLGHDYPEYIISEDWLEKYRDNLVIHAKNLAAVEWLYNKRFHWFYHTEESVVMTSKGWLWSYPKIYMVDAIVVELGPPDPAYTLHTRGVCTDYPVEWLNKK